MIEWLKGIVRAREAKGTELAMNRAGYAATVSILLIAKGLTALDEYPQLGELCEKARKSHLPPGECARLVNDYVDIVERQSSLGLAAKKAMLNNLISTSICGWDQLMKIRSGEIDVSI